MRRNGEEKGTRDIGGSPDNAGKLLFRVCNYINTGIAGLSCVNIVRAASDN